MTTARRTKQPKDNPLLTKKNLKDFRKQGLTYKSIAKKLRMSTSGLYYYYWKWNLR